MVIGKQIRENINDFQSENHLIKNQMPVIAITITSNRLVGFSIYFTKEDYLEDCRFYNNKGKFVDVKVDMDYSHFIYQYTKPNL